MARSVPVAGGEQSRVVIAENWFTELKAKLASARQ